MSKKYDLGGVDVLSEFDRIAAIEAFKELGEGVGTIRTEEKDVTDKLQPDAGLLRSRMNEVLFKEAHEQVGV
jgi:hypothetical protein